MILRGTVFSKVLEMDTGITIVGPSGLPIEGNYRVAYLLHGLCGRDSSWVDTSLLPVYAAAGKTLYILPDGVRSFYTDMAYGQRYFTYLTEELPSICQSLFHISARREDTAVLGCSMGGYGALKCALSKPEQYGMCAAFASACLFLKEGLQNQRENGDTPEFLAAYGRQLPNDFVSIFGQNLAWKPENEILELAKRAKGRGEPPKLYLTCGTRDAFYADHERFTAELGKLGCDFSYEEWEGGHDFYFFDESLRRAIAHFQL